VKYSREVKVGLLTIVSLTLLYFGFSFLKGTDFLTTENKYYVAFDNIDGLTKSNSVILNGLAVGRVASVEIAPKMNNRVLVTLDVDRTIPLNDSTRAILTKTDLLGEKAIVLDLRQGSRTLRNKDTLIGFKEQGITEILTERALPVIRNFDTTLMNFSKLSKEYTHAGEQLNVALKDVAVITRNVAQITQSSKDKINQVLVRTEDALQSLQQMQATLQPVLDKLALMADTINEADVSQTLANARNLSAQLNTAITEINQGKGTLGKLAKDDSLYINLNRLTADLDKLAIDFKEHPKRYVHFSLFGKKDKGPKK
jgi:phospholipid/cholesterol/gamma-HCH transport system substrate-binding protein